MVQDTLEKTKKLIWPVIDSYLKDPIYPKQFALNDKFKKEIDLFWKINREYPERMGKYIRPTLVRLMADALGTESQKVIKTAAAMQLSEDWMLIHDDIEDKSDVRRGAPTLHKLYGEELAINAGDSLHMIMWKVITDIKIPEVSDEFYRILLRTALGQGIEQIWTNERKKLTEDEYFFVADGKSAYYSITGPMRLGAITAGATQNEINRITDFGLHLGRCFQLVDDLIDADQDRKEKKTTLVTTKGLAYVKGLAAKERDNAKKIFEKDLSFLKEEPARIELKELIDFILERKY